MKKRKLTWANYRVILGRIEHIEYDWLTPAEYIPYISALLGDIDLDPCSTHNANSQFLRARKIYTLKEDGLNIQEPWTGTTYLFPPTYGRCSFNKERGTWRWSKKAGVSAKAPSVIWFKRLLREWKLRNIPEALCGISQYAYQLIDLTRFTGKDFLHLNLLFIGVISFIYLN